MSTLPTVFQNFEHLMQKQMKDFVENFLSSFLCGYGKGYNSQYVLLAMIEHRKMSLDNNGLVAGPFKSF